MVEGTGKGILASLGPTEGTKQKLVEERRKIDLPMETEDQGLKKKKEVDRAREVEDVATKEAGKNSGLRHGLLRAIFVFSVPFVPISGPFWVASFSSYAKISML